MDPLIDASQVSEAVKASLYKDAEITDGKTPDEAVVAMGITRGFGFHPERLERQREKVESWLMALPSTFRESGDDGGWSFLAACNDKNGRQWGEHHSMEELFCLGMGLGLVKCQVPREMWKGLPGGMPYYSINVPEPAEAPGA